MNEAYGCITVTENIVPLMGVRLEGRIVGRSAGFTLHQRFRNGETKPVEAIYRFPLPESAALCGFKAQVADRVITGSVEERDRAFELYDDALQNGDGGYLLDQERPNVFTLSVGNLNPGQELVVTLDYAFLLDMEGPRMRLLVPTTIAPRYIPAHMPEQGGIPEAERVNPPFADHVPWGLSMSLRIYGEKKPASISSPSHPVQFDFFEGHVAASFCSDSVHMDRDFILYLASESVCSDRAFHSRMDGRHFLQLDLCCRTPEKGVCESKKSPPMRKDTIFVLDCSGSMTGDSMAAARRSLEILLRAMTPGGRFNIYRFGSLFERLFSQPQPYNEQTLDDGLAYLSRSQADLGGTEMMGPLKDILDQDAGAILKKDIVLITDGEVADESALFELMRDEGISTRLFAVGIGAAPNEHLVKGLARAGRGASVFVHPGERIESRVLPLYGKIRSRTLENLKIQWGTSNKGVEQAPVEAEIFENETTTFLARLPETLLPPRMVSVTARLNGDVLSRNIPVMTVESDVAPIPLLWARERIRDLEENGGYHEKRGSRQMDRKNGNRRESIISLSRDFKILSRYTSYVALEERAETEKNLNAPVLRRIPVSVAVGWHGMGSLFGGVVVREPPDLYDVPYCKGPSRVSEPLDTTIFCRTASSTPSPAWSFPIPFMTAPPVPRREAVLLEILSRQKAAGGMEMDQSIADALGIDFHDFTNLSRRIKTGAPVDRFLLLSTGVLLYILEKYFKDQRLQWEQVVLKSREWLSRVVHETRPVLEEKPLAEWVEQTMDNGSLSGKYKTLGKMGDWIRRGFRPE